MDFPNQYEQFITDAKSKPKPKEELFKKYEFVELNWDAGTHRREKINYKEELHFQKILPNSTMEKPFTYSQLEKEFHLKEDNSNCNFNFTLINKNEIILKINTFDNSSGEKRKFYLDKESYYENFNKKKATTQNFNLDSDMDIIITNAYPIVKYHFLFLPFYLLNKPQFIDSVEIIQRVISIQNNFNEEDDLAIGYNSKGASSSINSLHFQMFFLSTCNIMKKEIFFLNEQHFSSKKIRKNINGNINVYLCESLEILKYFKIVFSSEEKFNPSLSQNYTEEIFNIISILNQDNIPYNILFLNNETFIFPRRSQHEMKDNWIGVNELLGQILMYTPGEFESYDSDSFINSLKASRLDDIILNRVISKVLNII